MPTRGVTVLGDTVNFAARLQALAEPNSVFMSEATHRLVQGMVEASFAGDTSDQRQIRAAKSLSPRRRPPWSHAV